MSLISRYPSAASPLFWVGFLRIGSERILPVLPLHHRILLGFVEVVVVLLPLPTPAESGGEAVVQEESARSQ